MSSWAKTRAFFIALSIALGLVDGCPIPTQRVMEHLPPWLARASAGARELQSAILSPFSPIRSAFGLNQRWALFSSTGPERHRISIEARRGDGPWIVLFRPLDDEHRTFAWMLEYRRVRNAWNPNRRGTKPSYPGFVSFISRQVFLQDPTFDEVRVRMERGTVLPRGQGFVGSGDFDDVEIRARREVLP